MVSLTKVTRKLRKKTGLGAVKILGAGTVAEAVLGRWREERDKNLSTWRENYETGVENADIDLGVEQLALWYETVGKYSDELSDEVRKVYNKIRGEYRAKKERIAKVVAEKVTLPVTVRRR